MVESLVWYVVTVIIGGPKAHYSSERLSETRAQFERSAAPTDKQPGGNVGWCHGAT